MFDWHDILERAGWTAAQAALAALPPGFILTNIGGWKVAGLAGITAGFGFLLSAAKNLVRQQLTH
jgi:hypothetical protein